MCEGFAKRKTSCNSLCGGGLAGGWSVRLGLGRGGGFWRRGPRSLGAVVLRAGTAGSGEPSRTASPLGPEIPVIDFHVHLDNSTIDQVLELSRDRGVRFGIVEHAGTKENQYPVVLSNDAELGRYLAMLEGKPVFRGVQAEWIDWSSGFSRAMLARLDYVLMDAMTYPGKDGKRVKLWEPGVESRVDMADQQAFMDRFVDWHVELIEGQPIDILGNVSWLPAPLAGAYDRFWTAARIGKVVGAAVRRRVAIEISSSYELPKTLVSPRGESGRGEVLLSAPTAAIRRWAGSTTASGRPRSWD